MRSHRCNKVFDLGIKEVERVAAVPSSHVRLKITRHEMTSDRSDGEITPSIGWRHSVGEIVIPDPCWFACLALSCVVSTGSAFQSRRDA